MSSSPDWTCLIRLNVLFPVCDDTVRGLFWQSESCAPAMSLNRKSVQRFQCVPYMLDEDTWM